MLLLAAVWFALLQPEQAQDTVSDAAPAARTVDSADLAAPAPVASPDAAVRTSAGAQPAIVIPLLVTCRIVDEQGLPIAGARVSCFTDAGLWPDLLDAAEEPASDADGLLQISAARPSKPIHSVIIDADAYHAREQVHPGRGGITLGTDEWLDLGTVVLAPRGAIRGRVVDGERRGVNGVRVHAINLDTEVVVSLDLTGPDGKFELPSVPAGVWTVQAKREQPLSHASAETQVFDRLTATLDDLVLAPPPTITGTVVDETGQPLAGIEVQAMSPSRRHDAVSSSQADGRFELVLGERGRHVLWVDGTQEFAPWGSASSPACVFDDGARDARIVLKRNARLSLSLVDAVTQRPVTRAGVHVVRGESARAGTAVSFESAWWSVPAQHDWIRSESGIYALPARPGVDMVVVQADGYVEAGAMVRLDAGNATCMTVQLQPASSLSGRVLLDGQPCDGLTVVLTRLPDAHGTVPPVAASSRAFRQDPKGETSFDGRFAFERIPQGRYRLNLGSFGCLRRTLGEIRVEQPGPTDLGDIALEPCATIVGTLELAPTVSARRFSVSLRRAEAVRAEDRGATPPVSLSDVTASVDEDTRAFALRDLAPGTYELRYHAFDYLGGGLSGVYGEPLRIDLAPGEVENVTLDARSFLTARIAVQVLRHGQPVPGAWVRAELHENANRSSRETETDAQGWTNLELLGGQRFKLVAVVDGRGHRQADVVHTAPPSGQLEIRFELRLGSVAVELPADFALPASGELVLELRDGVAPALLLRALTPGSPLLPGDEALWTGRTHEFGEFEPGSYEARVKLHRVDGDVGPSRSLARVPLREAYTTTVDLREGERTVIRVP